MITINNTNTNSNIKAIETLITEEYTAFVFALVENNPNERFNFGMAIHEQLVGNSDYIDCGIVLNFDMQEEVILSINHDCKQDQTITL